MLACAPMSAPHSLPEILAALEANSREIVEYFPTLSRETFFSGDEQHWGPAHHLSHLTIAHKRVAKALAEPGKLPPHQRARSRTFEQVREVYTKRMAQVPPDELLRNPLPPRLEPGASQAALVMEFHDASATLRVAAACWGDADFDARAIPHPFLGWLSAREMLLFFVHHDRSHLDNVRRRFGAAAT